MKNPLTRNSTVKLLAQLAIYPCTPVQTSPMQSPNSHNISPTTLRNTSQPLKMFSATSKEPSIIGYTTPHHLIPHSISASPIHPMRLTLMIANHTPVIYSSTTAPSYGNLSHDLSPHCHRWNLNISNSRPLPQIDQHSHPIFTILTDSEPAINHTKNINHLHTKHIDTHYHYIHEVHAAN